MRFTQTRRFWIGGLCLVIGLLCLLPFGALAQVPIDADTFPDANFRRVVETLDTVRDGILTDEEIAAVSEINVEGKSIASLKGLEVFIFLKKLYCPHNDLTSLPPLPSGLEVLYGAFNELERLPELPQSLTTLDLYSNQLTELPALPNTLTTLDCAWNDLSALPALPDALTVLECYNNRITALPALPDTLTTLKCYYNQITVLPELPGGLKILHCNANGLTALQSPLPSGLEVLACSDNQLTQLPPLPDTVTMLYCDKNQLTALQSPLPSGLEILACGSNQLTQLPSLPETLTALLCNDNFLAVLPMLPGGMTQLNCNSNLLTSLPALPGRLRMFQCAYNRLTAVDLSPAPRLQFFAGINQSPTLWLAGNDTDSYTLAIELNAPTGLATGLSYANGVLKSDSKTLKSSPFTVETGHARFWVDGTLTLKYGEMIAASAGEGGSITPSGQVGVEYGKNQAFAIKADTGYRIQDVLVNGESIGKEASYTFTNVQAAGSIAAQFEKIPYTLTASCTLGGSITPLGKTTVLYGGSQAYTIAPDAGYRIQDVKVNGKSIGAVTSYTFENVKADAAIEVSFEKVDYTITATAGKGGTISPTGAVGVLHGESQTFTLTAEDGYRVKDVKVNGKSLGVMSSYTFSNVQADATIEAIFEERPIDPVPPTGDRFPLEMLVISLVGMVFLAVVLLRKAKKA